MKNKCLHCGNSLDYSEIYDAYYCIICNTWTEKKCEDQSCQYCSNRPEDPLKTFNPMYKKWP